MSPNFFYQSEDDSDENYRANYFTLEFKYTFKFDNDIAYFATHKPYSFERLQLYL